MVSCSRSSNRGGTRRAGRSREGRRGTGRGGGLLLGFAAALPRHFRPLVSWFVGAGSASSFWLGGAALLRPQDNAGVCWTVQCSCRCCFG
uniref:Uncharacterized protein n=1 Tax=Zea mays TaxID=4577 RepID=A0A804U8S0_MAIZE